jgi:hypothetical protein
MKLPLKVVLGLIAIAALALIFWPDMNTTQAQEPCKSFDAVGQLNLFVENPLPDGSVWGGQVYVKMGDEFLRGLISGEDGDVVDPNPQNNRRHGGMPTPGMTFLGFNCGGGTYPDVSLCNDTIHIEVPNSIFGAKGPGFNQYQGNSAYINGGTGRFENATGNVTLSGPYINWKPAVGNRIGAYNPEFNGHICGVE